MAGRASMELVRSKAAPVESRRVSAGIFIPFKSGRTSSGAFATLSVCAMPLLLLESFSVVLPPDYPARLDDPWRNPPTSRQSGRFTLRMRPPRALVRAMPLVYPAPSQRHEAQELALLPNITR